MLRRTLADFLDQNQSRASTSLGYDPNDPRTLTWLNRGMERLWVAGKWIGSVDRARINVTDQMLTLPARYATAEQIAINHEPLDIRSPWFEFDPNGWGTVDDPAPGFLSFGSCGALRRNSAPTFKDIPKGSAFKVRVVCDVADDGPTNPNGAATAVIQGFDGATPPNWVRTNPGGVWQNGETLAMDQISGSPPVSHTFFSKITGIQFSPGRLGQCWLYMMDGASPAGTVIGQYEYREKYPSYERYLLPFISANAPAQVDILGKLNFWTVSQPSDWLPIPNLEALRLACMGVKAEEEHRWDEAAILLNGKKSPDGKQVPGLAVQILENELRHFSGSGVIACFRTHGAVGPEGEPIEALL